MAVLARCVSTLHPRIAAGYDADILAVSGDPVAEPAAIHRLLAVYVRGEQPVGGPAA